MTLTARVVVAPRVFGAANGIRFGPDGLLWVCSAFGGMVGRVDVATGETDAVVPVGGGVGSADDVDFDSEGNAYFSEYGHGRVTVRAPDGTLSVLADDLPGVNGLTVFEDRVIVDENRRDGRMLELHRDGRPHRLIAEGLQRPNALAVGPDRFIYFPIAAGEVLRVPLEGGPVEPFVTGLGSLTSVTHDGRGTLFVTEHTPGAVLEIDVATARIVRRREAFPSIDNLAIDARGAVYLSSWLDGEIAELLPDGGLRRIVAPGLVGPYGLAFVGGELHIADGLSVALPDGTGQVRRPFGLESGFHVHARGLAEAERGGFWVSGAGGDVARWGTQGTADAVVATGLREPMGVADDGAGGVLVAEAAAGRVVAVGADGAVRELARGLERPTGVARGADGTVWVGERATGRLLVIGDDTRVVADGLGQPEGLAVTADGTLLVVDAGGRRLVRVDPASGATEEVASGLAVGAAPPGAQRAFADLLSISGSLRPFADVAVGADGRVVVGCDADGTVVEPPAA